MARGFVEQSLQIGLRDVGAVSYSHPHEDCGQKSTANYERFDFKVPYAFMHYGEWGSSHPVHLLT